MTTILAEIRSGAYYDSVVLMQLQRSLAGLPNVLEAGVVMGTAANKDLLAQSNLLVNSLANAVPDDLIIVVNAADEAAARFALAQVDELLTRRRSQAATSYRPKSLDTALKMLPEARWVLISVPGRYAAGVARQALALKKNVFLYSDNVSLEDEVDLKQSAARQGLLVMGPDCGTAIVTGVGLGFANRVRRGSVGVVGASGTGLQLVTSRIHQLGGGITHALGTGGRDLSEAVGAITARQSLDLLARDPATAVIVLISKPPSASVAAELLTAARASGKPVVVNFIGYSPTEHIEGIHFARTLDETAELAVHLSGHPGGEKGSGDGDSSSTQSPIPTPQSPFLRGLFSGGTLAYEALLLLQEYLPTVYSNAPLKGGPRLANAHRSQEHTIVDLGEDEFTVGRLHPMLDNDLRIRRLLEEAEDPDAGLILFDVVLGDGAHPDPAVELAPAVIQARSIAQADGRDLIFVAVVVGTDLDPQDMARQIEQLTEVGVHVFTRNDEAIRAIGSLIKAKGNGHSEEAIEPLISQHAAPGRQQATNDLPPVDLDLLTAPLSAVNVGLESFTESLTAQNVPVVQVDWRPPAGGNERLMGILARMKRGV